MTVKHDITPYSIDNIYQGDCAELLKKLPCSCIDLTVTSPPYDNLRDYNGYTFDFETIAQELFRVTAEGGVVVWVVGDATINGSETGTSFRQAIRFMEIGFRLHDTMIYKAEKPPNQDERYHQSFEYMFVFSKGKIKTVNLICDKKNRWAGESNFGTRSSRKKNGELRKGKKTVTSDFSKRLNIWEIKTGKGYSASDNIAFQHPAIFPESLARDHILSWSNPGDLVLDPFMGSGTTAKMAHHCQRHYLGFEISQEYIDIANERLRQRSLFEPA